MNHNDPPPSHDDLGSRIARARARETEEKRTPGDGGRPPLTGFSLAFRVGVDLVAGLAVGIAIGVLLDRWLGTGPWLLVVFFVLGAGAGLVNVFRTVSGLGMGAGYGWPRHGNDGRHDGAHTADKARKDREAPKDGE
jgi:ATP synthase protein I